MAFQPGLPGSQFPSDDALIRRIQDLERDMRELRAANPFAPMGMTPNPNGVTFGGSVVINGNLAVPSGSITNAALENPISGTVASGTASNFALPGGAAPLSTVITTTISVPAGFSRALVIASADMEAVNTTASPDYSYVRVRIAGNAPTNLAGTYVVNGKFAYVGSNFSQMLTGIGASFPITVEVGANTVGWPASDINVANLSAMVTFLR